MCLAIPAQILQRDADSARVDINGLELDVDVSLVPEARVGDYVIVHVGIALSVMSQEESLEALVAHRELATMEDPGTTT
jgi:hydrogenase expression/formation protein HypC